MVIGGFRDWAFVRYGIRQAHLDIICIIAVHEKRIQPTLFMPV